MLYNLQVQLERKLSMAVQHFELHGETTIEATSSRRAENLAATPPSKRSRACSFPPYPSTTATSPPVTVNCIAWCTDIKIIARHQNSSDMLLDHFYQNIDQHWIQRSAKELSIEYPSSQTHGEVNCSRKQKGTH